MNVLLITGYAYPHGVTTLMQVLANVLISHRHASDVFFTIMDILILNSMKNVRFIMVKISNGLNSWSANTTTSFISAHQSLDLDLEEQ